jgi:hypothetical protein
VADADERADALPQQEEFWRPPLRFGSVPVEKEPLAHTIGHWGMAASISAMRRMVSLRAVTTLQ